jgi:co-chaperonin GroES (HSP10)
MQQNFATAARFNFQSLDEAFPGPEDGCDSLTEPLPHLVLLQIRRAKQRTAGGLYLTKESQEAEAANTQVAKVLSIGCNCFRNPNTGELWREGAWFKVGDYLRIPQYNGYRFTVKWKVPAKWAAGAKDDEEDIKFVMFEPIHLTGLVRGDPRAITAYA